MILVIQSQWNHRIGTRLSKAAIECLKKSSAEVERIQVPGALEIPLGLQWAAKKFGSQLEGAVACGVIIRGETYHFELVANECSRGLNELSLELSIPVGHCVLACETLDQAECRAGAEHNRGREAAEAVLAMLQLKKEMRFTAS